MVAAVFDLATDFPPKNVFVFPEAGGKEVSVKTVSGILLDSEVFLKDDTTHVMELIRGCWSPEGCEETFVKDLGHMEAVSSLRKVSGPQNSFMYL